MEKEFEIGKTYIDFYGHYLVMYTDNYMIWIIQNTYISQFRVSTLKNPRLDAKEK